MSDNPLDALTFVSALADLQPWQKELIEQASKMRFDKIEQRILARMVHPVSKSSLEQVILGVDWADGIDRTAMLAAQLRGDGVMVIIDDLMMVDIKTVPVCDIYEIRSTPFREDSLVDQLMNLDRHLPTLAQDEPEPTARNGAKASKKTERAKAKLAFYQGKRRF